MPWNVRTQLEKRKEFIDEVVYKKQDITTACQRYGISRKTGHKWLSRFRGHGESGLKDRSRRPRRSPNQTKESIVEVLIKKKQRYPKWGPKKIRVLLKREGIEGLPSKATIGRIFERYDLVKKKRRRSKRIRARQDLTRPMYANHVWAVDFKGWFKTRDGKRCEPLTITDLYSRYLIECYALENTRTEAVQGVFERVFKKYGLPLIIRSDNGSPFSSQALCGLSRLSVWWMKLGIMPELIEPAHPEQNGEHERMHRTLKHELLDEVGKNITRQQMRFEEWKKEFNEIRPHEALGMQTPDKYYKKSERRYKLLKIGFEYPTEYATRSVKKDGYIRYGGSLYYLTETLKKEKVGLKQLNPQETEIYFQTKRIGKIIKGHNKVLPMS